MEAWPLLLPSPTAVLFDAYGTLFDVYSVGLLAEQLFPGQGERLAVLWRDKQIDYTRLVSMSGAQGERYQPFWTLTRWALQSAAERLGLALGGDAEDRLMNQYRHLSAFPENLEVLQALRAQGIPAGILSNGDPDMLSVAIKSAGLDRSAGAGAECAQRAPLQDRPGRLRPRAPGSRPPGARDSLRVQQRLGRHRCHLVRLHHAVGQPGGPADGTPGGVAHSHRQQPA